MSHVMFDLETWGTWPGCALRSIGAVVFDPMGKSEAVAFMEPFYRNINRESCIVFGLRIEPDTAAWWDQQSPEAVAALQDDQRNILDVVREFHDWLREANCEFIWCHGANFDEPIWQGVCKQISKYTSQSVLPWKYWNVRCTRTLYWAAQFDPKTIERKGVTHNALDDAIYQAQCAQAAMKILHAPGATLAELEAREYRP